MTDNQEFESFPIDDVDDISNNDGLSLYEIDPKFNKHKEIRSDHKHLFSECHKIRCPICDDLPHRSTRRSAKNYIKKFVVRITDNTPNLCILQNQQNISRLYDHYLVNHIQHIQHK